MSISRTIGARSLSAGLSWSAATDIGSKLAVLVTTFVAVRALTPVFFGQYAGLLATAMLAAVLWDAGSSTLLIREFAKGGLSVRNAVSQLVHLRRRLVVLWFLGFALGSYFVLRGHPLEAVVVVFVAVASVLSATWVAPVSILRAALDFKRAGLAIAIGRAVTAMLSITALMQPTQVRLEWLTAAVAVGEASVLMVSTYFVHAHVASVASGQPTRLTVRGSLPFAANGMLSIVYNRFDVVVLAALASTYQLSLYAPASRIQDALYVIPTALGVVALPVAASIWSQAADHTQAVMAVRQLARRLTLVGLIVALPSAAIVWAYTPELIRVVLGPAYTGAATPTRILVWFLPLAVIQAPVLAVLAAAGYARDTTKVFAVTFLVAVGMHLSLDWWAGATGGAIASLARDPIAVFVVAYLAWKRGLLRSPVPGQYLFKPSSVRHNLAATGDRPL